MHGFSPSELIICRHAALLFFVALLASLFLTPRTIRLAKFFGAVDSPDGRRKVHSRAIPRMGGASIALSFLGALLLVRDSAVMPAFEAGAIVVVLVGLVDDRFPLHPAIKFAGQVVGAAIFVFQGGFRLETVGDLFCRGPVCTGIFAPGFTVFCMVGVMNALNLSDGLDGLAGGISAIACVFFAIFACLQRDSLSIWICAALLGGIFGFLRYNTFPARLFMGDSGSLLLGYSLSALAIILVQPAGNNPFAPITVAGVLALPVIDTILVMARRLWHGQNPFLPDKTHLHHRLLALGLPHAAVVPILYAAMGSFGLLAWGMRAQAEWRQFASLVALGAVVYGTMFVVQRLRGRISLQQPEERQETDSRIVALVAAWMGKSVPVVSWIIVLGLVAPALTASQVPGRAGIAAFGMAAFMMALFPWRSHRVDSGICFGLIYSACVCLLGILHLLPASSEWLGLYLAVFSALVLVWVLLKMKVQRGHKKVMMMSGFEALLVGVSIFISTVLVPAVGMGEGVHNALLMACLESIPLLLALKILVRKQPRRNYLIAASLLGALVFLGLKGLYAKDSGNALHALFPPSSAIAAPIRPLAPRLMRPSLLSAPRDPFLR